MAVDEADLPDLPRPKQKPRVRYEQATGRYVFYFTEPLFRRWRKPLRQWLSHRSGIKSADLDDLVQEVFLRLLRYSTAEVIGNPQGYLFRIAHNVATEWE